MKPLRILARVTILLTLQAVRCALAQGEGVHVIPVTPTTATVSQSALELLTRTVGVTPLSAFPVSLAWSSPPGQPPAVSLRLEVIPGPSFQEPIAKATLVGVSGSLEQKTAQGRRVWAVARSNFESWSARANYVAADEKLNFILPVTFTLQNPAPEEPVHAVLLVVCRLHENDLSCGAPRFAFGEIVRREFPASPRAEDKLPWRVESVDPPGGGSATNPSNAPHGGRSEPGGA
jgi:hypothetical protein